MYRLAHARNQKVGQTVILSCFKDLQNLLFNSVIGMSRDSNTNDRKKN